MPRSRFGESSSPDARGEPTRAEGAPGPGGLGPAKRPGAIVAAPPVGKGAAALLADDDDSLNLQEESGSMSSSQKSEPLPENERAFGRFTLLRRLAYGGMGEIFLARQGGAGSLAPVAKLVVIKRILSHMKRDEKHRKMFLDEARLQAVLTNPHIVAIHDMGEESGHVYLAMEHVHGPSWRSLIDRCRRMREHIPLGHIAQMVAQAARGLSYAHNLVDVTGNPLRFVHRDINPHNLLVNYDGVVKIIDFGIAKSELADGQTETGTIKGKFSYMSPEQSAAMPLDHRSDIFALGICLYELLTLDNPFRKNNVVLSLESIQRDTPAPLERKRRDAVALQTVVDKCLAKNKDDRFDDCGEIARVLDSLVAHGVIPHADKPLSTWLRELFADEIAAHVQILEQTGSASAVARSADPRGRVPRSGQSNPSAARAATPSARVAALAAAADASHHSGHTGNAVAALLDEHSRLEAEGSSDDALADVTSAEILDIDQQTSATPDPLRIANTGEAEPMRTTTGPRGADENTGGVNTRTTSVSDEFNVPSIADSVEPTKRRARWPFFAFVGVAAAAGAGFLMKAGVIDRALDGQAPLDALTAAMSAAPETPETPEKPGTPPKAPPEPPEKAPPAKSPDVDPPPQNPPAGDPPPEAPPVKEPPGDGASEPMPAKRTRRLANAKRTDVIVKLPDEAKKLAGTLLVTSEGYQVRGNRKLAVGEQTTLTVADTEAPYAVKLRAKADLEGNVTFDVESEPWSIVRVDGVGKGRVPQRGLALPRGRRLEIELTNPKAGAMKLTLMLGGK